MNPIKKFLELESASGLILFAAALGALVISNSAGANFYNDFFTPTVQLGINDGLMSLFFLVVGLELKREMCQGQLSSRSQIILPGLAALGGMIIPAIIYVLVNSHHPNTGAGWPIPVATDIAFALGALSLFGKRIPLELKLFLMALAIMDDLGAILIIAFFHLQLSWVWLLAAAGTTGLLVAYRCRHFSIHFILGLLLWFCVFKSGIHPTIAGVIFAFVTPLTSTDREPAKNLEDRLSPWVAFGIMPLFAFANSGIAFGNLQTLNIPLILGIILGLCVGKQIGVFGVSALLIKLKWARLPQGATWLMLYGTSLLCGIGFTMSLFIGTLAFHNHDTLMQVRLAVLSASMISGVIGSAVLWLALRAKKNYQHPSST